MVLILHPSIHVYSWDGNVMEYCELDYCCFKVRKWRWVWGYTFDGFQVSYGNKLQCSSHSLFKSVTCQLKTQESLSMLHPEKLVDRSKIETISYITQGKYKTRSTCSCSDVIYGVVLYKVCFEEIILHFKTWDKPVQSAAVNPIILWQLVKGSFVFLVS